MPARDSSEIALAGFCGLSPDVMPAGDSSEIALAGFCGLSPEAQKKILEARCGGLCYVPPAPNAPAEEEKKRRGKRPNGRRIKK